MTGEDLGYKPDVIQKAKFEYFPLGKVFNKGLDESNQKEGLLKWLKNIERMNKDHLNEIEYQGQKQLDAIKKQGKKNLKAINEQEKQLKKIKNQKKELIKKVEREEELGKIVLLKDNLNNILVNYGELNIDSKGGSILRKLADYERSINYKNIFFNSGSSAIDNYDFFKRFGSLYDLLIDLLNEKIRLKKTVIEQIEMTEKIEELRNLALLDKKNISEENNIDAIKKTKTQRRKTISIQKSVINNALRLFDKRGIIIDAFENKSILSGDLEEDFYQKEEPEYQESIAERTKMRRQNQQKQSD